MAPTPSPDVYEDLTRRSPTPGPRGLKFLPRSSGIPSGDPHRPVKRSASMGLLADVMSHAVKWRENIGASPVKRSPLKRALSADDSPLKGEGTGQSNPSSPHLIFGENSQRTIDQVSEVGHTETLEVETEERVGKTSDENQLSPSQSIEVNAAVQLIKKSVSDDTARSESRGTQASTSTTEESISHPPAKPWTKLNRILGTTDLPESIDSRPRTNSRLGFHVKRSADSLNSLFKRQGRGSPCKEPRDSLPNSRASSSAVQRSEEIGVGEGAARRTDGKGSRRRFWWKV